MKHLDQTNANPAKQYRQLKSLYKVLLKSADKLDYVTFKKRRNFWWSYLTDAEVVDCLLLISSELKTAYHAKDADQYAHTHLFAEWLDSNKVKKHRRRETIPYSDVHR